MSLRQTLGLSIAVLSLTVAAIAFAQEHPRLIMTKAGVERIRAELGTVPLFDATVKIHGSK